MLFEDYDVRVDLFVFLGIFLEKLDLFGDVVLFFMEEFKVVGKRGVYKDSEL